MEIWISRSQAACLACQLAAQDYSLVNPYESIDSFSVARIGSGLAVSSRSKDKDSCRVAMSLDSRDSAVKIFLWSALSDTMIPGGANRLADAAVDV